MSDQTKPLGFWMCTALIIGNIIGMGIFMLPASLAPYGWNAFLGWAVTLLGCVMIALVFANLARAFPQDDGPYAYFRRAFVPNEGEDSTTARPQGFGELMSFFALWCYWVSIWITNATVAIGVVGYLSSFLPTLNQASWFAPAASLGLIWFFVAINIFGARTSGHVQMVTVIIKLMPMVGVLLLGVYVLMLEPALFQQYVPPQAPSLAGTTAAATIAMFAMLGVESATIPAGKVNDPQRTIPRATMVGTMLAAFIYIGVSAIPLLLLPSNELAQSSAPFVDLFQRYLPGQLSQWIALFVIVSGLGALNGWTLLVGEMTASMASHGVFPAALAKTNRHGAPAIALILTAALASVMILMNYSRSLAQGFTFLSVMVTAANMPLYAFGTAALFVFWKRGQLQSAKPGLLVGAAVIAMLYIVWVSVGIGSESLLWVSVLGLAGLPVCWGTRWWRSSQV